MNDNKFIDVAAMAPPKGGGAIKGIGEPFRVNQFTGEGSTSISLPVSPCRDSEPHLTLSYSAGNGNGLFGMGFSLNLAAISRKTNKGIPTYDDNKDIFVLAPGSELTPVMEDSGTVYLCKDESEFSKIEYVKQGADSFWKITDSKNGLTILGQNDSSRISDPGCPSHICSWLISETRDDKGNRTVYTYDEKHHIKAVQYGNYFDDAGIEHFAFSVQFHYTKGRNDCFCQYNNGFLVETHVLCHKVTLHHHLEGCCDLNKETAFTYADKNGLSLLTKVSVRGYKAGVDGFVESLAEPDFSLSYTDFEPATGSFEKIEMENKQSFALSSNGFQVVDLYGEGIAGLLYVTKDTAMYAEALGECRFGAFQKLDKFPILNHLSRNEYTLMSLEGNGRLELVSNEHKLPGYFELKGQEWEDFKPFKQTANEQFFPYKEYADLQGDGLEHLMMADGQGLRYYPSLKKEGVGFPVRGFIPEDFPLVSGNCETEIVTFMDLFGDGLSHRVRIKNGSVECWPNLGYGKFGDKRSMGDVPYIKEGFDASRIQFADLDGSGTTDFIYCYHDRVEIWLNRCGEKFEQPLVILLPELYSDIDTITFADIKGNGTSCMIFSKLGVETRHYCYDFAKSQKPFMLKTVDNHMGLKTNIYYKSSTVMCLEDKRHLNPWKIKPPFPVQLISKTEDINEITGHTHVTRYRYRDGLYDFGEREFIGFGMIESWKEERFAQPYCAVQTHQKSWYEVGNDYSIEYNQGDEKALKMEPHLLPAGNQEEAGKAIRGRVLREEIYEEGNNPCQVMQMNYRVQELMAPKNNQKGAYFVQEYQKIDYKYESDISDPAITHSWNLETDQFGNCLKQAMVCYPRRAESLSHDTICPQDMKREQEKLHVILTCNQYANVIKEDRYLGIPLEIKRYEINGIHCDQYFTGESLFKETEAALWNIIPYGQEFDGERQARPLSFKRLFYWNGDRTQMLAFGTVEQHALIHHIEEGVFPTHFPVVTDRVQEELIMEDCGYEQNEGYYWNSSAVRFYGECRQFFLPWKEEHRFRHQKNALAYDPYCLIPVQYCEYVNEKTMLVKRGVIDYNVLEYSQISDYNGNVSQVLFDPLGQVIASTQHGLTEGVWEGNGDISGYNRIPASFEDIVSNPEKYLQNMTSCVYYDLCAYEREGIPVQVVTLAGNTFCSDHMESVQTRKVSVGVSWLDGTGNSCMEKCRAEDGNWKISQRKIADSRGNQVFLYPASETNSPYYETFQDLFPTISRYDSRNRVIQTEKPRLGISNDIGYLSTNISYQPWFRREEDENCHLQDSQYYQKFMKEFPEQPSQEQKDCCEVLKKGTAFSGKGRVILLDGFGRDIGELLEEDGSEYVRTRWNLNDCVISISDARLRKKEIYNQQTVYDMQGKQLHVTSCDAGEHTFLRDVCDKVVHSFQGSEIHKRNTYDSLNRLIQVYTAGVGLTEQIVYGDALIDGESRQLNGKVYRHFDQSGIETTDCYTINGLVRSKSVQLLKEYKETVDWSVKPELAAEEYKERFGYDILGQMTYYSNPDGTVCWYERDSLGQLVRMRYDGRQGAETLVESIKYNAEGKKEKLIYGNQAEVRYFYDGATKQLRRVLSTRMAEGKKQVLQDLTYTLDPVGNLSRIRDAVGKAVYHEQQKAEPVWDYDYDQYNRLTKASGRTSGGHQNDLENLIPYTRQYSYDFGGNITQVRHMSSLNNFTKKMVIRADSNRLAEIDGLQSDSRSAPDNLQSVEYDEYGNMKSLPGGTKLKWNSDNRLVHALILERDQEAPDEEYYTYDYNGDRRRKVTLRKVKNGLWEKTEKIYLGTYCVTRIANQEGDSPHRETEVLKRISMRFMDNNLSVATMYRWDKDEYSRETKRIDKDRIHYQMGNHLDCISVELNEQGEVISFEEFYPFGGTALIWKNKQEVFLKEYRYCNKELDSATGLYYYGARYYSPAIGRMISADGTEYAKPKDWQSFNLFSYCRNNPIVYTDLDGHDWKVIVGLGLSLGLGVIAGVAFLLKAGRRRTDEIVVNFRCSLSHDMPEFKRQLRDQQNGMNKLTVYEYQKNRDNYKKNGRAPEGNRAQQAARENAFSEKVTELRKEGIPKEIAEAHAKVWMGTQAALHNPDQIAGGNPSKIEGLGDKSVNASIGAQWKNKIETVNQRIQSSTQNMTEEEKKQTFLNMKLICIGFK